MPTPRRTRPHAGKLRSLIGLTAVAVLLVAACGSDDDGGDAAASTTTTAGPSGATTAAATTTPTDVEPFTLRVGYISTGQSAWGGPEGYANETGLLLDRLAPLGVSKIETFGFANGPEVSQAIAGGSLDIAGYGDTPALNGRASGLPTRAIGQSRVDLSATLYTPKDGVTTVEELDGKTIGVAQGSFMHRFVLGFLEAEGLADSVTVTNIPVAEYVPALTAGDVAAVVVPWSLAPLYDAQGFRSLVSTFPDYPDLAGSSVTVITEDALKEHPGLPEAWNAARAEVLKLIAEDAEAYYDFQQPILKVDRAVVPTVEDDLENYSAEPFSPAGLALLEGTKAFLVEIGAAKSDFPLSEWIVAAS